MAKNFGRTVQKIRNAAGTEKIENMTHTVHIDGKEWTFDDSGTFPYGHGWYLATLHTSCREHGFLPTCRLIEGIYERGSAKLRKDMRDRNYQPVEKEIEFVNNK